MLLNQMRPNGGPQLRRAISIHAEGIRLLEKHAGRAVSCKACYALRNIKSFNVSRYGEQDHYDKQDRRQNNPRSYSLLFTC